MSSEEVRNLIWQAEVMEAVPAQVSLLEQAVRLADIAGDTEAAYDARTSLIRSAIFSGMGEKALPAFSWCLAHADKHPEKFGAGTLLWEYKWILHALIDFPSIGLQQIQDLENDFETRLQRGNFSLRPIHSVRVNRLIAPEMQEEKTRHFDLWKKSKRDSLADCHACEESDIVTYLFDAGQEQKGLTKAFQMLEKGVGCHSVPHRMIGRMLLPLLRQRRHSEAEELHVRGYRMVNRNRDFLESITHHINYLLHRNENAKAMRMMIKHLPWAAESNEVIYRMLYFHSASMVLEKSGKRVRKLRLPRLLACFNEDGSYQPQELGRWFRNEAEILADHFDARDGIPHYRNWMEISRAEVGTLVAE